MVVNTFGGFGSLPENREKTETPVKFRFITPTTPFHTLVATEITWGGEGELEREPASGESLSEISSSTTAPGRSTLAGPEIKTSNVGPL